MAHIFNATVIYYATTSILPWIIEPFGIPAETSWIPDMVYYTPQDMTLMQRFWATVSPLHWEYLRRTRYFPALDALVKERLPSVHVPPLEELERMASLVFINSHFSEEYPRALPPFVVPVGGAHCFGKEPEKLPMELEKFISGSTEGFFYISLGSYADVFALNPEVNKMVLEVLRQFSQLRFVMKTDAEPLKDKPENVLVTKWAPQTGLLAHPKIRGFITHSGLLGLQEAIYYSVPLITMPVFAEQDYNAERIVRNGLGISLEITALTENGVRNAINEILRNNQYGKNMKKMSEMFKDRQVGPKETAVWWTEYVLRHRDDPPYHKPLNSNQTWYQRRLLDVWLLVLVGIVGSFILSAVVLSCILKTVFRLVVVGVGDSVKAGKDFKLKDS